MNKLELLNLANKGYPDGFLSEHFDPETGDYVDGRFGDALAAAIVAELTDTFDPDLPDKDQVEIAIYFLSKYARDIAAVQDALAASLQEGYDG